VLRNGVLTVRLEAREGEWHPERDTDPGSSCAPSPRKASNSRCPVH
jgi:hypothetical protein